MDYAVLVEQAESVETLHGLFAHAAHTVDDGLGVAQKGDAIGRVPAVVAEELVAVLIIPELLVVPLCIALPVLEEFLGAALLYHIAAGRGSRGVRVLHEVEVAFDRRIDRGGDRLVRTDLLVVTVVSLVCVHTRVSAAGDRRRVRIVRVIRVVGVVGIIRVIGIVRILTAHQPRECRCEHRAAE